jgi:hypothetical protein
MMSLLGRGQVFKSLLMIIATLITVTSLLAVLSPKVTDQLNKRFESFQHLSEDDSARTRAQIWSDTPAIINANPLGLGLGAIGRGAVASTGNEELVNVDSGPLAAYLTMGWVAGTAFILGMCGLVVQCISIGRRLKSGLALALAAGALCIFATFPFLSVLGFEAVLFWICVGYAVAISIGEAGTPVIMTPAPKQARPRWAMPLQPVKGVA